MWAFELASLTGLPVGGGLIGLAGSLAMGAVWSLSKAFPMMLVMYGPFTVLSGEHDLLYRCPQSRILCMLPYI